MYRRQRILVHLSHHFPRIHVKIRAKVILINVVRILDIYFFFLYFFHRKRAELEVGLKLKGNSENNRSMRFDRYLYRKYFAEL